jgi:hypothetical protein
MDLLREPQFPYLLPTYSNLSLSVGRTSMSQLMISMLWSGFSFLRVLEWSCIKYGVPRKNLEELLGSDSHRHSCYMEFQRSLLCALFLGIITTASNKSFYQHLHSKQFKALMSNIVDDLPCGGTPNPNKSL